jgi:hypothetical protein
MVRMEADADTAGDSVHVFVGTMEDERACVFLPDSN